MKARGAASLLLLAAMIAALVRGIAAGCLARALLSRDKRGVAVTRSPASLGRAWDSLSGTICSGATTCTFRSGALLPSAIAALVLLLARSKVRRNSRSKMIFG